MGLIVSEVYDALIEAGASPVSAKAAAGAVPPAENMATRDDINRVEGDIARIEANMATRDDINRVEGDIARIEANMATRDDIARIEKQIAVLRFAVFTGGPAILAFMVKLTFFP